ncbi:hypothetical protein PhiCrAssBcn13_74 [Bacteroides phage PhiCrAssBcn13]|nr:hypothetical protein PhiCrAssBcn13_74 [Bacteroides phage PhiCrAssBcn13]
MVRTIYVVYTDQKLGYSETRKMKQYMFLYPFDNIQAGDMIKDKRYSTAMQVVGWDKNSCEVQNGIKLKVIEPFLLNGKVMNQCTGSDFDIDKQRNNMEEKRNVAISLEEAREWYKSGNNALKAIALKAYSESELAGYNYMKSKVSLLSTWCNVPNAEEHKWNTLHKMAIIAKYYNGSWEMKAGKTGYFIGKSSMGGSAVIAQIDLTNGIAIYEHKTVQYAGIVYFKNAQDAKEAAKLLFDELNLLF